MRNDEWSCVRRILVMRLDNVGDVVLTGPALRTLRHALPHTHITLMVSPAGSQVAELLPWIDDVLVQRTVWQDASAALPLDPRRELDLVERIREGKYDAAIILTSFSQSPYPPAYVCYLAGIPLRIGQSSAFGGSLLTTWVRSAPDGLHQAERNLYLLERCGFEVGSRNLELQIPTLVQQSADQALLEAGIEPAERFIVLAPGASCAARRYDLRRMGTVGQILGIASGLPIVVIGAPRESATLETFWAGMHSGLDTTRAARLRCVSLAGRTSVGEAAAVIRRSALVIGNDSGPMHLADAFARPLVILFSGTDRETEWTPRQSRAELLRRPTGCAPCRQFVCPFKMECLDISPEEVVTRALRLLESAPPVRPDEERAAVSVDDGFTAKEEV